MQRPPRSIVGGVATSGLPGEERSITRWTDGMHGRPAEGPWKPRSHRKRATDEGPRKPRTAGAGPSCWRQRTAVPTWPTCLFLCARSLARSVAKAGVSGAVRAASLRLAASTIEGMHPADRLAMTVQTEAWTLFVKASKVRTRLSGALGLCHAHEGAVREGQQGEKAFGGASGLWYMPQRSRRGGRAPQRARQDWAFVALSTGSTPQEGAAGGMVE